MGYTTAVEKVDVGSVISTAEVRYDAHTAEYRTSERASISAVAMVGFGPSISTRDGMVVVGFKYVQHTAEEGYSAAVEKVGFGPVISTGDWYVKHTV